MSRSVVLLAASLSIGLPLHAASAAEIKVEPVARHVLPPPATHLTAITVLYPPGSRSRPHRHGASAFVYVLEGAVRSQVEGEDLRTYTAGQSWFEAAGAHHTVAENPSADTAAKILVVFTGAEAAPLSIVDK